MKLFSVTTWLKAPLDRDVIARWTVGGDKATHTLEFPAPPDPARFSFLALGDTGDSEASGTKQSPQDAVAVELARDAALPETGGNGLFTVHTGDVVYMTGEKRMYERNFRRPYAPFLTPESTIENFTFRLPFLPVPGNHDYYDPGGWAGVLARVPLLRVGVRAALQRLFSFELPVGGSGMGGTYMHAFVDSKADTSVAPLPYLPGNRTLLPNRYYKFTVGTVDFFALDSNTLEAPAPWKGTEKVRADAALHVETLEARGEALDKLQRRTQRALAKWQEEAREAAVRDKSRQHEISDASKQLQTILLELQDLFANEPQEPLACNEALPAIRNAIRRWNETLSEWNHARDASGRLGALQALDEASIEVCAALTAIERCLGHLPADEPKAAIERLRDRLEQSLQQWTVRSVPPPADLAETVHRLSEEELDLERELAVERLRLRYLPEDYDQAQLKWLDRSLEEARRLRPDNWRVVFLHHPLYTTASNHCEGPDVQGLRENLLPLLKDRVHLVLSGHAHAFEWARSDQLPHTGLFVTGGGGQVSLRPSLLASRRFGRLRERYEALRQSGVQECAMAGKGPDAPDGEDGLIYHYLKIDVTPEILTVRPIGVRKVDHGYRRESPLPVFHAGSLPADRPQWLPRMLEAFEIRRNERPRPLWK